MGAFDYMWNAAQSGRIGDHDERIEELEKKVEILHEWVLYLKEQLKDKNDSKS